MGPCPRLAAALTVAAFALFSSPAGAEEVARFAVVAGNNIGLPSAEPLRYAERDAERMAKLLGEIGGVPKERLTLLEGKSPDALRKALDDVAAKAQRASGDTVLIFYYSGHADSGWLRMGGRGISVTELRKRLELMPTKVRIAIVDACQSGAITRSKGGKVVSPFMEERPVDVEGLVILTSASAAEPAQESDVLRSSFFSHHLMSGLRGPADATGDGTVSALEAYEYAYRYTVQETEGTSSGAQHPTFLYALEGQGDVALTAIREGRVRVELSPGLDGTVLFIGEAGRIDAEVVKKAGEQVTVALAPGDYEVRWRDRRSLWSSKLSLADGAVRVLDATSFEERPLVATNAKGAEPPPDGELSAKTNSYDGNAAEAGGDDNTPLGGGAKWEGPPSEGDGAPATTKMSKREKRKLRLRPLSKREGARLPPAASFGASMLLPGLAHGIQRRYAQATLITGIFAASVAGAALLGPRIDESDGDAAYAAEYGGTAAFAFAAFYTYAYAAIDAFYYDTRGGPGAPDPSKDKVEIQFTAAPLLSRMPEGLRGGVSYGLGLGMPVHEHIVVGLRDLAVYPNTGVTSVAFSPEIAFRGMIFSRFGWSASAGALMQVHIETGDDVEDPETGFAAMPYVGGALHYFPGRAWSLDFGVRGGLSIGTRRALDDVAQTSGAFSVEYVGGLSWHR